MFHNFGGEVFYFAILFLVTSRTPFKKTKVKYIVLHKGVTFEKGSLNGTNGKLTITVKNLTAARSLKAKGKSGAKNLTVKITEKNYNKLSKKDQKKFNKAVKMLGATLNKVKKC